VAGGAFGGRAGSSFPLILLGPVPTLFAGRMHEIQRDRSGILGGAFYEAKQKKPHLFGRGTCPTYAGLRASHRIVWGT